MADSIIMKTLRRMPAKLYRYCSVQGDRILRIKRYLLEAEIYFPCISEFNDPLDCRIPITFDALHEVAEKEWNRIAAIAAPHQTAEERKKRVDELIQQTGTEEGRRELNKVQFRNLEKHGVLSLTKNPDSMLMWSYYADSHAGITLRFNMTEDNVLALASTGQCIIVEVVYDSKFPIINYYEDTTDKINKLLRTKASAWAHEQEWRIVLVNVKGLVHVPAELIDGIVLGLKTSPEDEASIRTWIQEREAPTELLRIRHKEGSFDLEVVPA